jgi:hypothetical protein
MEKRRGSLHGRDGLRDEPVIASRVGTHCGGRQHRERCEREHRDKASRTHRWRVPGSKSAGLY